jgi:hypothetical protein
MCRAKAATYGARMKRYLPSSTVAAALLAGALFASATGGAVAGSMITGKQIKDGSLTGKDLKDKSIAAADLAPGAAAAGAAGPAGPPGPAGPASIPGYQVIFTSGPTVAPGADSTFTASCPVGKKALGGGGYWLSTNYGVQAFPVLGTSQTSWGVAGINQSASPDALRLSIVCATAS